MIVQLQNISNTSSMYSDNGSKSNIILSKKELCNLGNLPEQINTFFFLKNCSSIDLVTYVLSFTGCSNLFITSYSISRRSLTALQSLKNRNSIDNFSICVDSNIKFSSPSACDLAKKICHKFVFNRIHAKVWLFDGDKKSVVISSMNLSHNPRQESGVISFDSNIFNFYKNQLDAFFK